MPIVVIALALSAFAVSTTEFMIVGIVPALAGSLGVSVSTVGLVITVYGLALAVGAPVITSLTSRVPRKTLLLLLMLIFAAANALTGLAPDFPVLLAGQIIAAVAHGTFFGVGAAVATQAVAKNKAGQAIALLYAGVSVALIVAVPLGSLLGNALGWRVPFLLIAALALLSTTALAVFLSKDPAPAPGAARSNPFAEFATVSTRRLGMVYLVSVLGVAALLIVFTYLAPLFTNITHVSVGFLSVVLVVFGVGTAVGSLIGGRLNDTLGHRTALLINYAGLIIALILLPLTLHSLPWALANTFVLGCFGFMQPPTLTAAATTISETERPGSANMASSMVAAGINIGIAAGSFIGGRLILGPGLLSTPFAGAILAALAIIATYLGIRHRQGRPAAESDGLSAITSDAVRAE